ncbi:MAG: hypothetical protein WCI04_03690 [archaeon]
MGKLVFGIVFVALLVLFFGCISNSGGISKNNSAQQNRDNAFTFANNLSNCSKTVFTEEAGGLTKNYEILGENGNNCDVKMSYTLTQGVTPSETEINIEKQLRGKSLVCPFKKGSTSGTISSDLATKDFVQTYCSGDAKEIILGLNK